MGEFNFGNVTVNGGQTVVGQNQGGMHQGNAAPATVASFFESLAKALPQDDSEQSQRAHEALNNIELMASATPEIDVTEADKSSFSAMLTPYIEKLTPYAPMLTNVLLAFGDGFFSTLASKNPVVAGVVEAFKAARQ